MKIEHIAYMVREPAKVAQWYVEHCGMQIKRQSDESPFAHFLADSSDRVMIEIYNNPTAQVPDYNAMDPLVLHLAFYAENIAGERDRLLEAGAHSVGDVELTPLGDTVAMLRDPWGFPVQLVKRATPMI